MEMHQVRYFLAVAELLNFTRAAERLHVAQPSLTRAVQKLEEEFGGLLFHRERANTHLTELGRMVLPHLQATLVAAQGAQKQALDFRKRESGQILLGACSATCARLGGALLAATTLEVRGLDFHIRVMRSAHVEEQLLAGTLDAGLLSFATSTDRTVQTDRLDRRPVAEDGFVVAFAPGHRFEASNEITLNDLDGEPLVEAADAGYEMHIAAAMEARGISRLVRHVGSDERWLCELVLRGFGCLVWTETVARARGLPHRPLAGLPMRHRLVLSTVAGRRYSPALAMLVRQADAFGRRLAAEI